MLISLMKKRVLKKRYRDVIDELVVSLKSRKAKVFVGIIFYYLFIVALNILEGIKWRLVRLRGKWRREDWHTVNNYKMVLPISGNGIVRDLWIHKTREPISTEYFGSLIRANDIIIDIGANIGYYVILESFAARDGKIYAVEPVKRSMQTLCDNLKLNGVENVFPFIMALGDSEDKNILYVYEAADLSSFVKHDQSEIIEEAETMTTTLDSFIRTNMKERPNIIRMDLEGWECQVIDGAKDTISNRDDLIFFIEIHPRLASLELVERMLTALENGDFKVDKIFVEPLPREFGFIGLAKFLRRVAGMPGYGYAGNSYQELRDLLMKRVTCHVFFSRYSQLKA